MKPPPRRKQKSQCVTPIAKPATRNSKGNDSKSTTHRILVLIAVTSVEIVLGLLAYFYREAARHSVERGAKLPKYITVAFDACVPTRFSRRELNPDPFLGKLAAQLANAHFHFDFDRNLYFEAPSKEVDALLARDSQLAKLISDKVYQDIDHLADQQLFNAEISQFELLIRAYARFPKGEGATRDFLTYLDDTLGSSALTTLRTGEIGRARTYVHLEAEIFREIDLSPRASENVLPATLILEALLWPPQSFALTDTEIGVILAWIDDPFVSTASLGPSLGPALGSYAEGRRLYSLRRYAQAARCFETAQKDAGNVKLTELSRLMEARAIFWGAKARGATPVRFPTDTEQHIPMETAIKQLVSLADQTRTESYRNDIQYYLVNLP